MATRRPIRCRECGHTSTCPCSFQVSTINWADPSGICNTCIMKVPDEVLGETYVRARGQLKDMGIPLPQREGEFSSLCAEVKAAKPTTFVEIGSRDGGSLWMLGQFIQPASTIISIDLPGAVWGRSDSGANKRKAADLLRTQGHTVHLLELNSQENSTVSVLSGLLGEEKIDFLFIDGDHRFKGVVRDWELYFPLVRMGGMVAFHDIVESVKTQNVKVWLLWAALKATFRHKQFVDNAATGMGIGVLWKELS